MGVQFISKKGGHNQISLHLYFSGGASPELYRTVFTHPETEILVAKRGRSKESTGGFTWTPAVQAMSYFLVQSLVSHLKNTSAEPYVLSGTKGSFALSIVYAIQKSNSWLFDMFGSTFSGQPLFKSFLDMDNIALRNARPMSIFLKPASGLVENISIYIDESSVRDVSILETLAGAIKGDGGFQKKISALKEAETDFWQKPEPRRCGCFELNSSFKNAIGSRKALDAAQKREAYLREEEQKGSLPAPFLEQNWKSIFQNILLEELESAFKNSSIFSRSSTLAHLDSLKNNQIFKKYSQGATNISHKIDLNLNEASRVGVFSEDELFEKYLADNEHPIKVCLSATQIGALAIFYYLKYVKGFNFEINLSFAHSSAISDFIKKEHFLKEPDICCLSLAPAACFLASQKNYRPLMFLPCITYQVIAPKSARILSPEQLIRDHKLFYLHHNQLSTAKYCFDELVFGGLVSKKQVKLEFSSPRSLLNSFAENPLDARAILSFPYYQLDSIVNQSLQLSKLLNFKAEKETFAFVHQKILKDEKRAFLLNVAIRDAWMNLKNNTLLRQAIVSMITESRDYLSLISRYSGIEDLERIEDSDRESTIDTSGPSKSSNSLESQIY